MNSGLIKAISRCPLSYSSNTLAELSTFPYYIKEDSSSPSAHLEVPGCAASDLGLEVLESGETSEMVTDDVATFFREQINAHTENGYPIRSVLLSK